MSHPGSRSQLPRQEERHVRALASTRRPRPALRLRPAHPTCARSDSSGGSGQVALSAAALRPRLPRRRSPGGQCGPALRRQRVPRPKCSAKEQRGRLAGGGGEQRGARPGHGSPAAMGASQSVEIPGGGTEGYHVLRVRGPTAAREQRAGGGPFPRLAGPTSGRSGGRGRCGAETGSRVHSRPAAPGPGPPAVGGRAGAGTACGDFAGEQTWLLFPRTASRAPSPCILSVQSWFRRGAGADSAER